MPLKDAGGSSSDAALAYTEAPWVRKRVVGRGNFGKARLLENEVTGELVVSKEAKLDGSEEARRKQSCDWSKEVELHSKLFHPHIIGYRGSFQQNDMFCIVMDYAAGGTLDGRIAQQKEAGEPFCAEMILRWLAEMASALEHMHSHRVLHRDMKPANVLLSTEGEIKLADFGVSRLLGSQTSLAQTVLGTPFYMSPELFKGEPYSQPTDVWALGVVLFELLTLQRLRCSPSPSPSPSPAPAPSPSPAPAPAPAPALATRPYARVLTPTRPFTGDNIGVVMTRISRCDFDRTALAACAHPHELKLLVSGEGSHRSLLHPDPKAQQRGQSAHARSSACGHPPLQKPARLLRATLLTREEPPPHRFDADRRLWRRSCVCPRSLMSLPLYHSRRGAPSHSFSRRRWCRRCRRCHQRPQRPVARPKAQRLRSRPSPLRACSRRWRWRACRQSTRSSTSPRWRWRCAGSMWSRARAAHPCRPRRARASPCPRAPETVLPRRRGRRRQRLRR